MFKKVLLPQRIKADVLDGLIASFLLFTPMFVIYGYADYLVESFQRLSVVGIPVALVYGIFRDSVGRGTSVGKRALGLIVIDAQTGKPCDGKRVIARNVLDIIPVLDFVDFLLTCIDKKGQKIMDKMLGIQVTDRKFLATVPLRNTAR
jgi:uncharacterized RDD family membrane protein YckC